MSFTLSTLKTAIQDYLQVSESTFTSQLNNFIEESEDRIFSMVQLPDQRKNVQGSLSSSNRFLATPTDFYAPMSLAIVSSGSYTYLDFKHPSFIREYSSTTSTGQPKYYSLFDDTSFELAPVPNSDYTVELHYFYSPESITAGADSGTTWLSTNAKNTLLYGSILEGYTYMKGEPDLMALYEKRYEQALARLKELGEAENTRDQYRDDQYRIRRS